MNKQLFACLECGTEFMRYASTMSDPRRPFCSQACVGKSKRHGSEVFCAMCDAMFYRRFGEQDLQVRKHQFCSVLCYHDWRVLYRKVTTYPKQGARHIHRIVAEQYLGRPLTEDEVVHHMDLNKQNYQPSNLAVLPNQAFHVRVHAGEISDAELRRFSLI